MKKRLIPFLFIFCFISPVYSMKFIRRKLRRADGYKQLQERELDTTQTQDLPGDQSSYGIQYYSNLDDAISRVEIYEHYNSKNIFDQGIPENLPNQYESEKHRKHRKSQPSIIFYLSNELKGVPFRQTFNNNTHNITLKGESATYFPLHLYTMPNLTSVIIRSVVAFPLDCNALSTFENLKELQLVNGNMKSLPSGIEELTNLVKLNISHNKITNLPQKVSQLSSLTDLNISNNKCTHLPQPVFELKALKALSLKENKITEIPLKILSMENLQFINLEGNKLNNSESNQRVILAKEYLPIEVFYDELSNVAIKKPNKKFSHSPEMKVEIVAAIINQLSETGTFSQYHDLTLSRKKIKDIPCWIKHFSNIQTLDLSDNCIACVPKRVFDLVKLKNLYLSNNTISIFCAGISVLTNLERLDLNNNMLRKLPTGIGQLTNLKELGLAYNNIAQLSTGLCSLIALNKLDLSYNEKLQLLPRDIGKLTSLKSLDISGCAVTFLPKRFYSLNNLESLWMHGNKLDKRFSPEDLLRISSLQELSIDPNILSDKQKEQLSKTVSLLNDPDADGFNDGYSCYS